MAWDNDNSLLYVTNQVQPNISIIDLSENGPDYSSELMYMSKDYPEGNAWDIVLHPSQSLAYVSLPV